LETESRLVKFLFPGTNFYFFCSPDLARLSHAEAGRALLSYQRGSADEGRRCSDEVASPCLAGRQTGKRPPKEEEQEREREKRKEKNYLKIKRN